MVLLFQEHCPGGERHRDTFRCSRLKMRFRSSLCTRYWLPKLAHVEIHLKHQRPVARPGVEEDRRRRFGQQTLHFARRPQWFPRAGSACTRSISESYPTLNETDIPMRRSGKIVVGIDRLAELAVGHNHQVIARASHGGAAPVDVGDVTLFAGVQFDVIADVHQAGYRNIKAGEKVRKGVLQCESDSETADAESGEDRASG